MANGGTKLFSSIVIKHPPVLTHSRLYHLKPIGIGTPFVESLTSYLARLAQNHCWSTGTLMTSQIVPLVNKPYMLGNAKGSTLSKIHCSLRSINCVSTAAQEFVDVAEALTLQEGLRFLTFLEWKPFLPARQLLRDIKAWCPDCYQEWYDAGEIIYEPLIWNIEVVSVCVKHQRRLLTRCPHCRKQVTLLGYYSSPGYCSECGATLINTVDEQELGSDQFSSDKWRWHLWSAENVGNLLAASTTLPRSLSGAEIHRSICACIRRCCNGSLTKFATLVGRQKNTVWGWQQGRNRPTLPDILRLCYQFECSLLEFITADKALLCSVTPSNRYPFVLPGNKRKACQTRTIDRVVLKQGLENLLKGGETVSVTEAARRMECSTRTLYRISPILCKRIAKKYAAFRSSRAKARRHHLYLDIHRAASHLYADGIKPTGRNVARFLNKPKYAFRSDATEALREARQHLL